MNTEITRKDVENYITKAVTGLSEGVDADGGYLLTRYIANEFIGQMFYESLVASRCANYTWNGGGDGVKVPYSTSPLQNEPTTGIRAYWIDEAAEKTISYPQIGQINVDFGKLVIRVPITDELRADSAMVYDLVMKQGTGAMAYKIDYEILRGTTSSLHGVVTGVGVNGTTYVGVASAGGTVSKTDLSNFVAKLHPQAYKNAVWYVNAAVYQDIAELNDIVVSWSDTGKLYAYGFPVEVAPQLDTFTTFVKGTTAVAAHHIPYHMILGDFSRYVIVQRPPQVKESKDFRFEYDEQEIRIVLRIGGRMAADKETLDDAQEYGWIVAGTYTL
jgi:HK97 family phage major capsid protein